MAASSTPSCSVTASPMPPRWTTRSTLMRPSTCRPSPTSTGVAAHPCVAGSRVTAVSLSRDRRLRVVLPIVLPVKPAPYVHPQVPTGAWHLDGTRRHLLPLRPAAAGATQPAAGTETPWPSTAASRQVAARAPAADRGLHPVVIVQCGGQLCLLGARCGGEVRTV